MIALNKNNTHQSSRKVLMTTKRSHTFSWPLTGNRKHEKNSQKIEIQIWNEFLKGVLVEKKKNRKKEEAMSGGEKDMEKDTRENTVFEKSWGLNI